MKPALISFFLSVICLSAVAQKNQPVFPAGILYSYGEDLSIYPEGFVLLRGQKLLVEDNKETLIPGRDSSVSVTLTHHPGESSREEITVICTSPDMISPSRKALVLCIGESTTETQNPNPFTGSFDQGWNWVSMSKVISQHQGIPITFLGTASKPGSSIEAGYTAHGGWSSYTYLNWPCPAKMDPGAPGHFFRSEAMWYALGLQGRTGKEFSNETWQNDLIARTPFGKYPVDNHPSLVAFAKSVSGLHGYPVFSGHLQKWADNLARDPINEFYCLKAAKEGNCAFSLDEYLGRYRTMDDEGNRLESYAENPAGESVRGKDGKYYTIGSRIVSQGLLKRISVCRPTHIVVNIGINDGDSASSIDATAASLEGLLSLFGTIPTAHFVMRWPGACYPELWAPEYLPRQYGVNGNNERVMAILSAVRQWARDKTNLYLLDVWHCQSPVSQHQEKYADGVLDCSVNDVHTGFAGQMSAAGQVLGWLYYCLRPPGSRPKGLFDYSTLQRQMYK